MIKRAGGVLFACFLTIFIHYFIRYSYGALLPEMLPVFQITKAEAGVIYSSYFIAYTILAPIMGALSDRFNIRVILTVFTLFMALGAYLMSLASSLLEASFFFAITGIGCSACWAPVMALAQRWISMKRKGMALSFIDAGSSLGVMASGAVVPLIAMTFDWRTGWVSLGIFGLVIAILNFLLVRDNTTPETIRRRKQKPKGIFAIDSYRQCLVDRRFWLIGIAYLFTGFSIMIPFTFISTYTVQELSFPYESGALLITMIGFGGMIGKLVMGPLSDKIGRIWVLIISSAFIGAGSLGVTVGRGEAIMMAVTCVFGFGYGAVWSMYAACASDYFEQDSSGGIIGLWTVLLGIGLIISPIISGWIADITGTLYWSFFLAAAGGLFSILILIPMFKEPLYTALP
ncbi:MAG: MFS transporter [Deltaproteobacteria bacterium]|nr:MFS transporter [Deltaproteobacteria bacterium]